METIVIKVGGHDLDQPGFVLSLAAAITHLSQKRACIVVHGGGRAISDLMGRMDIQPRFINGQRVTDEDTLQVAEMVLTGCINKDLTYALLEAGVDALGLSGVDRDLLRVEPWSEDMGRVGRIVSVRADVLYQLVALRVVPVISPISSGPGGRYNVNADHAAGAIAGAVSAAQAAFITDVPGVKNGEDIIPVLTSAEAYSMIDEGVINGGMIPKINAALAALAAGAKQALITDLSGLQAGTGTSLIA